MSEKHKKVEEKKPAPIPLKVVVAVVESPLMKEFREFVNRGSIVDLAIGVAVGGAFTSIAKSLVDDIVMPIVGLILGGVDFSTLSIDIPNLFGANTSAHIAYGNFIQNVVNFLVIAFTVFLIVRTINRLNARAKEAEEKLLAETNLAEEKAAEANKAQK